MSISILDLALFAVQPVSGSPYPPADVVELNEVANITRSFRPKDEFDQALQPPSFTGRELIIELKPLSPSASTSCIGSPTWSYSTANRILYISLGWQPITLSTFISKQGEVTKRAVHSIWPEEAGYLAFGCAKHDLSPYTATNAYGVSYRIEPTRQDINAIADSLPEKVAWPNSFRLEIGGEEARRLVPNLKIRFVGTIADWRPDVTVACGSKRTPPTASSPYDRRFDLCLYNGRISRIELIDTRTGKNLGAIDRPGSDNDLGRHP